MMDSARGEREPQEIAGELGETADEAPTAKRDEGVVRHARRASQEPTGEELKEAGEPEVRTEEALGPEEEWPETGEGEPAQEITGEAADPEQPRRAEPVNERLSRESPEEIAREAASEAAREGVPEEYPGEASAGEAQQTGALGGVYPGGEEAETEQTNKMLREQRRNQKRAA